MEIYFSALIIALPLWLIVSKLGDILEHFQIITDNQKHTLDKIEELKRKINSKYNNLEIKKHFK
jgi:ABC-type nickel/cobalt efflux system permease component RcnA